jgi:hypothetical protein
MTDRNRVDLASVVRRRVVVVVAPCAHRKAHHHVTVVGSRVFYTWMGVCVALHFPPVIGGVRVADFLSSWMPLIRRSNF